MELTVLWLYTIIIYNKINDINTKKIVLRQLNDLTIRDNSTSAVLELKSEQNLPNLQRLPKKKLKKSLLQKNFVLES